MRAGRSRSAPVMGTSQCIRVGAIFAILGTFVALEGAKVIHISTGHVVTAVVLAVVAIVGSKFVPE